jgi:hypothetical protein
MKTDQECEHLCSVNLSEETFNFYKWAIDWDYHYTWFIDFLPSAYVSRSESEQEVKYKSEIPIGTFDLVLGEDGKPQREYYIYNHHDITV